MPAMFDSKIDDIIRRRVSCRTYGGQALADDHKRQLQACIDGLAPPPFASRVRLAVIENPSAKGGLKGTYGIVHGAATFLVGAVQDGPRAMEDYGYAFETAILRATDLGLGTCWIGGTLKRSDFGDMIGVRSGEIVPTISPLGYAAAKRSAVDTLFRLSSGSRKRKPFQELFFGPEFGAPLDQGAAALYEKPLEMVRLAPSSMNKQPWRVLVQGDTLHFLLQRVPGYKLLWSFDMLRIDLGIAMCHFDLGAQASGIKGRWVDMNPGVRLPHGCEYVVSWVREG